MLFVYSANKFEDVVILLNRDKFSNKVTVVNYTGSEENQVRQIPADYFNSEYTSIGVMAFKKFNKK